MDRRVTASNAAGHSNPQALDDGRGRGAHGSVGLIDLGLFAGQVRPRHASGAFRQLLLPSGDRHHRLLRP